MNQIVTLTAELTADAASRTISGKIVPLNVEAGSTNYGKVIFESGSIEIADPKAIKLLSQHDIKKPIGRMVSFSESEDAIYATFSVSRSQRGTEALILAEEGLQSGLSIGVEVIKSKIKDGVTYVSSSRMVETSLVTEPAFKSAQVTDIAAEEAAKAEEAASETQPKESETVVEETTAVEATPSVEAAAVEAARPTVSAMYYTNPIIEVTKRNYLENTLKANLFGDDDSRQWLRAADNDQTTGAGFIPTPQSTQLLNFLSNADRPMIDSITRGTMPEFGKTFELPKITEVPLVDQIDENGAVTESQLEASFITVTKKSFKGRAITTLELLTNSTPAFLDELLVQMEYAYAKDTEEFGSLKSNFKLTFSYEFLLRMTYNSVKIMTIPKIGYKHTNLRENSLFWDYKNGESKLNEKEVKFWVESAKKEYFFTTEREIKYEETL